MYLFLSLKGRQSSIFEVYCAVFIGCTTAVTRYHSLLFVVTRCHSLYYSLSLFITCCTTRLHSLAFAVTCCITRCHSLSLTAPLVVTRCTTRLSFINDHVRPCKYRRPCLTFADDFLFNSKCLLVLLAAVQLYNALVLPRS